MRDDPVSNAMRQYRWTLYRWGAVIVVVGVLIIWKGIPHIQTTYTYYGAKRSGWVPATDKASAWYISVTGWKQVHRWDYGDKGCPFVLFIPLGDCIDLPSLPTPFTESGEINESNTTY